MAVEVRTGKDLKGYTLVIGFPGIGLVGPIAVRHIVESTNMELSGSISSDEFPAVATIRNGVSVPPVRIYTNDEKKLAVVVSEIAFSEGTAKKIGSAIIDFARKKGIERIISIAGVLLPTVQEEAVFGVGSEPDIVKELVKLGIKPVVKGVTTGISAVLLENGRTKGVPVILLLGTLRAKEDFRAAAEIIKMLDRMLGLDIPYDELLERAKDIEAEIASVVRQTRRESNPMYG